MCADRYGNIGNCGVSTGTSGGGYDAFGRSRTSEPFTLADYSHQYGLNEEILSKVLKVNWIFLVGDWETQII